MNRREFMASALVFVIPTIHLLPSRRPPTAASRKQGRAVFMIQGWSAQDDRAGVDQVWITVTNSWRAAWR